jgi:hypothetical protein
VHAALLVVLAVLCVACAPAPPPVEQPKPKPDPTKEAWYGQTCGQLAAMDREAERLFQAGRFDRAASVVARGQPLAARLLSAPRPTLAAMEAVSDLDDLNGRMLIRNRRYGWARMVFEKNVVRWKNWQPQTAETARRFKVAVAALAECDRRLQE